MSNSFIYSHNDHTPWSISIMSLLPTNKSRFLLHHLSLSHYRSHVNHTCPRVRRRLPLTPPSITHTLCSHTHQPRRLLHILPLHLRIQTHFRQRLCQSDHRLQLARCRRNHVTRDRLRPLRAHLHILLLQLRRRLLRDPRFHELPRVRHISLPLTSPIFPHQQHPLLHRRPFPSLLPREQRHQMPRQRPIRRLVGVVENEVNQVESRQQRRRQLQILPHRQFRIISRMDGVCRRQNGGTCVQGAQNSRLCDTDRLLLHRLGETPMKRPLRVKRNGWCRSFCRTRRCSKSRGHSEPKRRFPTPNRRSRDPVSKSARIGTLLT